MTEPQVNGASTSLRQYVKQVILLPTVGRERELAETILEQLDEIDRYELARQEDAARIETLLAAVRSREVPRD